MPNKASMSINFVSLRLEHHSTHSGYDQLMGTFPDAIRISQNLPLSKVWGVSRLQRALIYRVFHRIIKPRCDLEWYTVDSFCAELNVFLASFRRRKQIIHMIYGEDQYWMSKRYKSNARLIVTYHQPDWKLRDVLGKSVNDLKYLDGVVLMSQSQVPFFAEHLEKAKIFVVPHGIDTQFFMPGDITSRPGRPWQTCLFVGNWLRDFDTLRAVIQQLNHIYRDKVRFVAITSPSNALYLENCQFTEILSNITEEELLQQYRQADLLLLPLKDCTANNAILEAMSCGLPVVTTDIGGIRDYADPQCAIFTSPNDVFAMVSAVETVLDDEKKRVQMAESARLRALEFDWQSVAVQMKAVYSKVLASPTEVSN